MVRSARRLGAALLAALLVAGCSAASTTPAYDAAEVGQPIETTEGQVIASRVVEIEGDSTGTGPFAGGAAGGILGPLGFLAGAGLGYATEQWLRGGEGLEYLVETADGRTLTIVQERAGGEPPLPTGTPVLVQMGALATRVVAPAAAAGRKSGAGGATDWVNPDTLPPGTPSPPPEAVDPL